MGTITYTIPTAGSTLNSIADPQVSTALQTILTWANGNIDAVNLSALLAQSATVNQSGQTVKGAVNIAASESRTNVAYGTLTTPDQVTGVVLPSNGLIVAWYQATWQESVSGASRAAIFVGSNQVKATIASAGDVAVQEAGTNGDTANTANSLTSSAMGLISAKGQSHAGDVTTGQVVGVFPGSTVGFIGGAAFTGVSGGVCFIFAAAGTYTISVQFKASSGSVTASNRKLWVQALSFS